MMRKTYGLLVFSLLFLLLLPGFFTKKWQISGLKPISMLPFYESAPPALDLLKAENQVLKSQIEYIKEWLEAKQQMEEFFVELKKFEKTKHLAVIGHSAEKARQSVLKDFLDLFSQYGFARIIYKEPFASSSFAWIDLGEAYNKKIQKSVIVKNSPVVVGDQLAGIVEEVYEKFSKIRLITDPNLVVSVEAVRGAHQLKRIQVQSITLLESLNLIQDWHWKEKELLKTLLESLSKELTHMGQEKVMAHGELFGGQYSPFLAYQNRLIGEGFYNRIQNLPSDKSRSYRAIQEGVIRVGDCLLTTGADGLFPKGLKVGFVKQVEPSKRGKFTYRIEAIAALTNVGELQYVQVLPPVLEKLEIKN